MTTEERLQKLERDLARTKRQNRWMLAGVILVLGVYALGSSNTGAGKDIQAGSFILVDSNGKGRAMLDVTGDVPNLALYDNRRVARAMLSMADKLNRVSLDLCDDKGKVRASLSVVDNQGSLVLWNEKGKPLWSAPR